MIASSLAARLQGIGKEYRLGSLGSATLRDAVASLPGRIPGLARRASRRETFWALKDVSLDIREGERLGIIGRNGAGKSTLLKILAGITSPTEGRGEVRGRVGALLEVGTGFHLELTGRDNIFLSGAILGMPQREIRRRLEEIIEFAGIGPFLDTPVKRYSSGMYLRLAFAVAAHLEPDVLLVDEVLAVGDADFQRKCLGRMEEMGDTGRTVVFISHSMPAVLRLCERVVFLDGGRLIASGSPAEVIGSYMHSDGGTSATREWPDPATAPGDDVVRLRSVSVLSGGRVEHEVEISQEIKVEVRYWHLSGGHRSRPVVKLHFHNEDDALLFVTMDSADLRWRSTPRGVGLVTATCRIPGHFLGEGHYFIHATVVSLNPTQTHIAEPDAVSFMVVDRSGSEGARGEWVGDFPGAVRPLFPWEVTFEPAPGSGDDRAQL